MQEQPVTKSYKTIQRKDVICLQNVKHVLQDEKKSLFGSNETWKYSFELKCQDRTYKLFAPTEEERDLWVNGFNRVLRVEVADEAFSPMGAISRTEINLHQQVMATEGNNEESEFR